jgi:AcrR family transcriptional regulator
VSVWDERRDTTLAAIRTAGLKLLADGGAEALTIRGVARELSLVPSALYRYVRSRDELITMLIDTAAGDLGDTVQTALENSSGDLRARWRAFAYALRIWMLAHPHEWLLIQGIPIPGYAGVGERSWEVETRVHLMLVRLGAEAEASGLRPSISGCPERPVMPGLAAFVSAAGVRISEETALAGLAGWHLLAGALYAEQLQQAGSELVDHERYYDAMVAASERLLFDPPA